MVYSLKIVNSVITPFSHGMRHGEESGAWRELRRVGEEEPAWSLWSSESVIFLNRCFAARLRNYAVLEHHCAHAYAYMKNYVQQCSTVRSEMAANSADPRRGGATRGRLHQAHGSSVLPPRSIGSGKTFRL